jgi:SAM-dependent methyltransferase
MKTCLTVAERAACPVSAHAVLTSYLGAEVSAEIALMHLLLATGSLPRLGRCLQELGAVGADRFSPLAQLFARHRDGLARAARLVEAGLVDARGADPLAAIREQYDRAVAAAPEAAVALYSLGDPAILDRATAELVAVLERWGLLGAERDALDIGCGIGRIERALAARLRRIVGIDLSPAMVAEAQRRCCGMANVAFDICTGRDLSQFAGTGFDLILAVDSFPCIVAAGEEIAARHIRDAAGLLRRGGSLAIFNFSYRGDPDADRREVAEHAAAVGLRVLRNGTRDLALWDGASFLLSSPSRRG